MFFFDIAAPSCSRKFPAACGALRVISPGNLVDGGPGAASSITLVAKPMSWAALPSAYLEHIEPVFTLVSSEADAFVTPVRARVPSLCETCICIFKHVQGVASETPLGHLRTKVEVSICATVAFMLQARGHHLM